jgi:hypothetical protein
MTPPDDSRLRGIVRLRSQTRRAGALGGADRDVLITVANAATMPGETIHNMPFPLDAEIVCDAMIAADAYGRAFREGARPRSTRVTADSCALVRHTEDELPIGDA